MTIPLFAISTDIAIAGVRRAAWGALREDARPGVDEWALYEQDVRATRELRSESAPTEPENPERSARPPALRNACR